MILRLLIARTPTVGVGSAVLVVPVGVPTFPRHRRLMAGMLEHLTFASADVFVRSSSSVRRLVTGPFKTGASRSRLSGSSWTATATSAAAMRHPIWSR
mgnify:CR=1 FL=1